MPTIVCQTCGRSREISIFETAPECENCGRTEFRSAEEPSEA